MHFIFDHIIAIIVGTIVILVVISNQLRTMEAGVEDTSTYVAKNNALNFAEMIEGDLNMTLNRIETSIDPFTWPITNNADGNTTLFSFYRDSLNGVNTHHIFTRYRLNFVDSLTTTTQTSSGYVTVKTPLYEVIREECHTASSAVPCTPFEYVGSSAPWVSDFKVTPMRINKSVASNLAETQYVQVSFTMKPPYRTERQVVDKLHWSTMLRVQPF